MPFFRPEDIANAFLLTLNGKFSLTIGMIMPLGWGEGTGFFLSRVLPLGQKKGIANAFGSKWQALAMIFAQKESIVNVLT